MSMNYRDFWQMQNEWECAFERDYANYCRKYAGENEQPHTEKDLPERPGYCWEQSYEETVDELVKLLKKGTKIK